MRLRRMRSFTEACVIGGCLLLMLVSLTQILLISNRTRQTSAATTLSLARQAVKDPQAQPSSPNTGPSGGGGGDGGGGGAGDGGGAAKQQPEPPKRSISMSAETVAKLRARTKAQQEVRELERSLVKLMRQNSRTPEQSNKEMATELYARRVGRIIQQVADQAVKLPSQARPTTQKSIAMVEERDNGAVPLLDSPFSHSRAQPNGPGVIASHRRTFSDLGLVDSRNRPEESGNHPGFKSVPSDSDDGDGGGGGRGDAASGLGLPFHPRKADHYSAGPPHFLARFRTMRPLSNVSRGAVGASAADSAAASGVAGARNFSHVLSLSKHSPDIYSARHRVPSDTDTFHRSKELCPPEPPVLVGNMTDVNLTLPLDIDDIMAEHADVQDGGEWAPAGCVSRHRVAFVIPYRDRWSHLKSLLYYLIPVLKRQQIHFRMFVVEQFGNDTFNKGRIMNAAFREALKLFDFQCVTFHDVDLVPEDDRNMYSCAEMPKHMSIGIDKFNYHLPYDGLVGGVLMFKTEHFQQVNGYSNMYWGWGAEDDDMTTRILHQGLRIYRPPSNIARYKMVKHDGRKTSEVSVRMKLLRSAARRSKMEGLNNIQYNLLYTHTEKLFTHFLVDIGHP